MSSKFDDREIEIDCKGEKHIVRFEHTEDGGCKYVICDHTKQEVYEQLALAEQGQELYGCFKHYKTINDLVLRLEQLEPNTLSALLGIASGTRPKSLRGGLNR